jgi:hypothetical protein
MKLLMFLSFTALCSWIHRTDNLRHNLNTRYAVAEIVAKKMKSHRVAESVILSACRKIVNNMFGEEYEEEILKIPISDNTISRRIQDLSQDFQSQVITNIKEAEFFAIQLDEATDVTG